MQAIILAAGMGKRLKDLTEHNTKCMVEVNGVSLIDRMLHQLERRKLSRIVIVVGYEGEKLMRYIDSLGIRAPVVYVKNPIYDKTNNIYSLALAKEYLCREDTLLLESDLIFDDAVIDTLLSDPRETLALVDKYESWMDGTCVKLGEDDCIQLFVPGKKFVFDECREYYKTVNLYKFSREFSLNYYVPFLDAYSKALGNNEYYEQVLRVLTMLDEPPIKARRLDGQKWYEIDDVQDLDIASSLFAEDDKRYFVTRDRRGGYWRYPKMIDFTNASNPFYPPSQMLDELKANTETLVGDFPSGDDTSDLLAAKNFSIKKEQIVVGNGLTELIRSLKENQEEPILTLSNPDEISGNYISKKNMTQLIQWTKEKEIRMLVDESSVDYADETDAALLTPDILKENPHLFVAKDLSKSFGIPGLRLGVLASGDISTMKRIKQDMPKWRINSFAEFYLQIAEKYKGDYADSLCRFREERARFTGELDRIDGVQVVSSQSDFIVFALQKGTGLSSDEIVKRLLQKDNLLVCDYSEVTGNREASLIKAAIRSPEDNDRLVAALEWELSLEGRQ